MPTLRTEETATVPPLPPKTAICQMQKPREKANYGLNDKNNATKQHYPVGTKSIKQNQEKKQSREMQNKNIRIQKQKTSGRRRILNKAERGENETGDLDVSNSNNFNHNDKGNERNKHDILDQEEIPSHQNYKGRRRNNGIQNYTCNDCAATFSNSSHLYRHKKRYKGKCKAFSRNLYRNNLKEIFPCNDCSAVYKENRDLKVHTLKCNPNQLKAPKCSTCRKSFTRYHTLMQHTRIHLKIYPYSCDVCKKCFTTNGLVHLHKKGGMCINEKKSVSLNNKNSEVKDINNKSSELKKSDSMFSCDICYKIFSDIEDCIKHERKHSQILKTSRSGRPLKAVVNNSSEIREERSDKENLDEINNTNTDQNCSDEEHIKENNDDVKVIETIEKACSPILEVVPTIKEIVGFKT